MQLQMLICRYNKYGCVFEQFYYFSILTSQLPPRAVTIVCIKLQGIKLLGKTSHKISI